MSENTAPEPQERAANEVDPQPEKPQDEVEELVDDLEVHAVDDPAFTDPCSGGCTGTC